jgi:hypothetical protein
MTTEDIPLQKDGLWVGIPLISESTSIYNASTNDMLVRLGASSTSYGITVPKGATVLVDETVYVRPLKHSNVPNVGYIMVTR